jgi:hypothetical protein
MAFKYDMSCGPVMGKKRNTLRKQEEVFSHIIIFYDALTQKNSNKKVTWAEAIKTDLVVMHAFIHAKKGCKSSVFVKGIPIFLHKKKNNQITAKIIEIHLNAVKLLIRNR